MTSLYSWTPTMAMVSTGLTILLIVYLFALPKKTKPPWYYYPTLMVFSFLSTLLTFMGSTIYH